MLLLPEVKINVTIMNGVREVNLCLHIHLINQSECSLYMCIYIYFYLLKCFRLLVREKAYLT